MIAKLYMTMAALMLILLAFAYLSSARADELPLAVQVGSYGSIPVRIPLLYITSRADSIVVQRLKVNRGNCSYFTDRHVYFPITLNFGQQLTVVLKVPCHILEAEISTNQGVETYSFAPWICAG